ncbi:MAG: hypothetical protein ABEK50_05405, partial [bacterium]
GALKSHRHRYTFLESKRVERSGKEQELTFQPVQAGTLKVKTTSGALSSLSMIRIGMVPFGIENPDADPPGPREYPTPLVKTLSSQFKTSTFEYVPPNRDINLIIRRDLESGGKRFNIRSLAPFSPGESRTLSIR